MPETKLSCVHSKLSSHTPPQRRKEQPAKHVKSFKKPKLKIHIFSEMIRLAETHRKLKVRVVPKARDERFFTHMHAFLPTNILDTIGNK